MKDAKNSANTMPKNPKPKTNSLKHLEQSVVSREMNNRYNVAIVVPTSLFEMSNPSSSAMTRTIKNTTVWKKIIHGAEQ
jgi:hypothetical protein